MRQWKWQSHVSYTSVMSPHAVSSSSDVHQPFIESSKNHLKWVYKLWCESREVYSDCRRFHQASPSASSKCELQNVYGNAPIVYSTIRQHVQRKRWAHWGNYTLFNRFPLKIGPPSAGPFGMAPRVQWFWYINITSQEKVALFIPRSNFC